MSEPEGDIVLIQRAELEELRRKGAAFGEHLLSIGEQPQVHFTIRQEKDYRYWAIMVLLAFVIGLLVLDLLSWNRVDKSVGDFAALQQNNCEQIWNKILEQPE